MSADDWKTDPVLSALVKVPRIIHLTPPLGAISIRDQAVRGHVVALRANRHWSPLSGRSTPWWSVQGSQAYPPR
jgi:hypothetical protein